MLSLSLSLKALFSAVIIVAVAELGKRSSFWAAALASLPLTSLLAFIWLHLEGATATAIGELSTQIFWLVLPSLVLFIVLPVLLRLGLNFWLSLALACSATVGCYLLMLPLLRKLGIQL